MAINGSFTCARCFEWDMYEPHKKYFVYPNVDRHGNMYTGECIQEQGGLNVK